MAEVKHTPGPWVVDANLIRTKGVAHPFPSWIAEVSKSPEYEANRHLISAAPDLLAACQAALACLEDGDEADGEAGDALREAIAKATGEAAREGEE